MGFGGDLIILAAARELSNHYNKKVHLVKYKSRLDKLLFKTTSDWSEVFENNIYISKVKEKDNIIINRSMAKISYVERRTKDGFIFKENIHAVELICEHFGVQAKNIEPEIFFSPQEYDWFNGYRKILPSTYIVVEPHSKDDFTQNRAWDLEKWQKVVDELSRHTSIVQLGSRGSKSLSNVTSIFDVSFRQAGLILSEAKLFMGTIGGLMHLAKAVKTPGVILHSGYEPMYMASYPSNVNLFKKVECSPCGLNTLCKHNVKCINQVDSKLVVAHVNNILKDEN